MSTATAIIQLPSTAESLGNMPARVRNLYTYQPTFDGAYRLTPAGSQLAAYRRAVAENPGHQPPPPRKVVRLGRDDWANLISAADASERPFFLRLAAARVIRVEA